MNIHFPFRIATLFFTVALISACSVDKLEARLQADPQCRPVMNAKTGALMPCPGTDKEFYKSIPALSLAAPKATPSADAQLPLVTTTSIPKSTSKSIAAPVECKPQLHQKSGSLMPCPAP